MGVSADGSSNALQSWDMLHGNVLLREWTVTDVSFYTNELLHFMAVEAVTGFHGEVVNMGVALTFVLLVIVVAVAAGPSWWAKLLAVVVVGVPAMGIGTSVQLTSPDHTGTAIPLLLTWIVLDRFAGRGWVPWAVAGLLAWGQLSDPLVMYIGALPLVVVSAYRMIRDRAGWGLDAQLILAALGSVILNQSAQWAIRAMGGWAAHPPTVEFADTLERLRHNLWLTVRGIAGNFGAYFPDRSGVWSIAMGVVHLAMLLLAIVTTAVVLWRLVLRGRGEPGDRLAELAAAGICVNLGAYLVSTLALDMGTSRQIIAVVPLAAVLVGRVWGPRLAATPSLGSVSSGSPVRAASVSLGHASSVSPRPVSSASLGSVSSAEPGRAPSAELRPAGLPEPGGASLRARLAAALSSRPAASLEQGPVSSGSPESAPSASLGPVSSGEPRRVGSAEPGGASLRARLAVVPAKRWRVVLVGVAGLLALELAVQAIVHPKDGNGRDIAAWLDAQGMTHGLGSYWYSNNITLLTAGRVKVFPVVGGERIRAYRSESRRDWYDPAVHDARFIVLDTKLDGFGDEATALRQFGQPARRHVLPTAVILVYDRNLLIGLPAFCVPEEAPTMADCPPHRVPLFG